MASELFGKANDEFIDENYQKAVELYSEALQLENKRDEIFCNRAQAFIKLERFKEAVEDATDALQINPNNVKAYLRQGTALFYLGDYISAKESFEKGHALDGADSSFTTWIRKCQAECDLHEKSQDHAEVGVSQTSATSKESTSNTTPNPAATTTQQPAVPPPAKSKYDWYQTMTHVVIAVMLKNVQKEQLDVQIQEKSLSLTVKLPSGSDYSLELDLSHPISVEQSSFKLMKTKIEVKLKKQEGIQWTKLEGEEPANIKHIQVQEESTEAVKTYPSSSHYTRDWDKLAQEVTEEEKNEKKEGDAALNDLFQKIYADGTDETKKAMMKSFYESGGTVLSTNWNEIGDKKTDIKPPDGMEYKKWDS